jgi:hypothetical protein
VFLLRRVGEVVFIQDSRLEDDEWGGNNIKKMKNYKRKLLVQQSVANTHPTYQQQNNDILFPSLDNRNVNNICLVFVSNNIAW